MRAENTVHQPTAARRRPELTRSKTIRALRELDASGGAVTFEIVAKSAGVSRSWLYAQPDNRAEIERLRRLHRAPAEVVPARQCTTDPSLLQRVEIANARNRELTEDNQRLRRQLAQALGRRLRAEGCIAAAPTGQDPGCSSPQRDQRADQADYADRCSQHQGGAASPGWRGRHRRWCRSRGSHRRAWCWSGIVLLGHGSVAPRAAGQSETVRTRVVVKTSVR